MNINDIYNAAIENNTEKLTDLLKKGEVDLNELIDFGDFDGIHAKVPLLYSVICHMIENGLNFSTLDILIKYGADVDRCIELKSDTFFFEVPLLLYAVTDWKSKEILEYLLSRGANPNSQKHEYYNDGSISHFSMVYFAIDKKERGLLDILLKYGADPNAQISINYIPMGFNQVAVPLFYAQNDTGMCVSLLNYGADINAKINTGYAHEINIKFSKYFKNSKPSKYHPLFDAIKKANTRLYPTTVNKNNFVLPEYRSKTTQSDAFEPVELSNTEQLKQKIEQLVHFDLRNSATYLRSTSSIFSSIFDGLGVYITVGALILLALLVGSIWSIHRNVTVLHVNPGTPNIITIIVIAMIFICAIGYAIYRIFVKQNEAKDKKSILSQRKKLLNEINVFASSVDVPTEIRWWNRYNGLANRNAGTNTVLTFVPFTRICKEESALKLAQLCSTADTIKGNILLKFFNSKSLKTLYKQEIIPEQTYKIAELCLWYTSDGMTIDYKKEKRSEKQVKDEMQKFSQKLDEKEKLKNTWEHGTILTDDERALAGMMTESDYLESRYKRREFYDEFEKKTRDETFVKAVVSGRNHYDETFYPSGIIAFDENDKIVAILLYLEEKRVESYSVDGFKKICWISSMDLSLTANPMDVLKKLSLYPLENVDVLSGKPADFSEEEWIALIYSSFTYEDDYSGITSQIKRMRAKVTAEKQKKLINGG